MTQFIKMIVFTLIVGVFALLILFETNPGRLFGRVVMGPQFNVALHKWRGLARPEYAPDLKKKGDLKKARLTLEETLKQKGVKLGDPVFIRIFKTESELEVWMPKGNKFIHVKTFPICAWSGKLGPKQKQGDKQAPEGFYSVSKGQLNPKSAYFRSFNLGYPNKFDRSFKRTGDYLMVHGNCVSAGCYAMTDPLMGEIWNLVTAALNNGQPRFHVHVFPFRMDAINMALHKTNEWYPFWENLKEGYDAFEATHVPPRVKAGNQRYVIRLQGGDAG